ncbi:MAG: CoA transferase subunit A [Bacteroidales bacterium]|nr:CoA transferase subunit A [Bacteroidales bacterium]
MNKVLKDAYEAIQGIESGMTVMFGGFGLCGIPENCLKVLAESSIDQLTCISNNAGIDNFGLGVLLRKHQMKRMIASYVGENKEFERQFLTGELEVELIPQGTLAERIRAGGAGIPAFFVPAGYGTEVQGDKEVRIFNGKPHIMELGMTADFAIVKAKYGDTMGNLIYNKTANNFNQPIATAGRITIAEVEELVPYGELDPNHIHTPGVYVQRIFQGTNYEKRIEFTTTRS